MHCTPRRISREIWLQRFFFSKAQPRFMRKPTTCMRVWRARTCTRWIGTIRASIALCFIFDVFWCLYSDRFCFGKHLQYVLGVWSLMISGFCAGKYFCRKWLLLMNSRPRNLCSGLSVFVCAFPIVGIPSLTNGFSFNSAGNIGRFRIAFIQREERVRAQGEQWIFINMTGFDSGAQ